jgi:hypothetical protein
MRRVGIKKFKMTPLFQTHDWDEINKYEKDKITEYDSIFKGYNLNFGGSFGDGKGKSITVRGKKFISINAASRYYNIDSYNVHQRMNKFGWTLRQALEIDNPPLHEPSQAKPFEVDGKVFKSFRNACKFYKLNEDKVRGRLDKKNNWTVRQAFEIDSPPRRGRNSAIAKNITVEGVKYSSISAAAEKYEINKSVVAQRIRQKWTTRQAFNLDKPPKLKPKKGKKIRVGDKTFISIPKAARYFKLHPSCVSGRLKLGWTINQTFNLDKPPPQAGEKNGIPIKVKGKKFSSMKKASKFYGLDNRKVWKRINKFGWSINEAFGLVKRKN